MRDVNEVQTSLRKDSESRAGHGGDVCMETVGDVSVDVDGVVSMSDRNSSLGNTATFELFIEQTGGTRPWLRREKE